MISARSVRIRGARGRKRKPVYEDLSRDDLLNRCLGGCTQNNNESFNSTVWSIAPKTSSSKKIVDIAANIAASIFNDGLKIYNGSYASITTDCGA